MSQLSLKHLPVRVTDLEVKSADDGGSTGTFTGYLSVYGNEDRQGDVVLPGAFTDTLAKNGNVVPLLWQHNPDDPIGELHLADTDRGLYVEKGVLNRGTRKGADAYALLKDTPGALRSMSIGYAVPAGGEEQDATGRNLLKRLDLWEGSLVTFPANPMALVDSVKALADNADVSDTQRAILAATLDAIKADIAGRTTPDLAPELAAKELTRLRDFLASIRPTSKD